MVQGNRSWTKETEWNRSLVRGVKKNSDPGRLSKFQQREKLGTQNIPLSMRLLPAVIAFMCHFLHSPSKEFCFHSDVCLKRAKAKVGAGPIRHFSRCSARPSRRAIQSYFVDPLGVEKPPSPPTFSRTSL